MNSAPIVDPQDQDPLIVDPLDGLREDYVKTLYVLHNRARVCPIGSLEVGAYDLRRAILERVIKHVTERLERSLFERVVHLENMQHARDMVNEVAVELRLAGVALARAAQVLKDDGKYLIPANQTYKAALRATGTAKEYLG